MNAPVEHHASTSSGPATLRFCTMGSVDDGKSTLIGRLLYDSQNLPLDTIESIKRKGSEDVSPEGLSLSMVTDGLMQEREQGITIDVAYRYFNTPKRKFILADTPGHVQYTRNMATGASTADLAMLLVDVSRGITLQTKRHAFIAALVGVPRILVIVNKMDLANYDESKFRPIVEELRAFFERLPVHSVDFIPVSSLVGDNVVKPSENMPWYEGESVLNFLENTYIGSASNIVDFRFPVQGVLRPHQGYRGYTGMIASGRIAPGEEVVVLPSMRVSKISAVEVASGDGLKALDEAYSPMSVTLRLADEIDVSRGDMIVRVRNLPQIKSEFEAMLVWMDEAPLKTSQVYLIQHTTKRAKAVVDEIIYQIDVNSLSRESENRSLDLNGIARARISCSQPLYLDSYDRNRLTGSFILVDNDSYRTVAAGMIIERNDLEHATMRVRSDTSSIKSKNLHSDPLTVSRSDREKLAGYKAATFWLTGLSGSGKTSVARALERKLFEAGIMAFCIDGDTLRHGLNMDLGFSQADRDENIRRAAEVARLMNQASTVVICSFITPLQSNRELAKRIIGDDVFHLVHIATSLDECERRDPHGLYKKARAGEIAGFTGVSAPYETPLGARLTIDTTGKSVKDSCQILFDYVLAKLQKEIH